MNIAYTKAKLTDIANMQKLVKKEVEQGIILPRSDDEIATNIRSYTLALQEGEIVGFCALHIHTPYLAEIRSLIVREDLRGMKIGENMVKKCIDEAYSLGLQKLLSLTYKKSFLKDSVL